MNATKPITMTTLQPAGAVFHRCALQVNLHPDGDAPSHAAAIVAKAVELGVSVLAVSGSSGVAAFRTAAAGQGITLFPGFELTSAEDIHVLCIYPPDTDEGQLEQYLGQLGVDRFASSADPSSVSFENVLTRVRVQGGVAIAAHAAPDGGLFRSCRPRHGAARTCSPSAFRDPSRNFLKTRAVSSKTGARTTGASISRVTSRRWP